MYGRYLNFKIFTIKLIASKVNFSTVSSTINTMKIRLLLSNLDMALISDGNSELDAHVFRDIGNLICLRHLFRSTTVADFKKKRFNFTSAQQVQGYRLVQVPSTW